VAAVANGAPADSSSSSNGGDNGAASAVPVAVAGGVLPGSSGSSGSWLPWVLQIRSNPSTGQVDVLTGPTREAVEQQAAAGEMGYLGGEE